MQEKSVLWRAALDYVAKGHALIPLHQNSKTPMFPKWNVAKLDTAEKVDALYKEYPETNIAICPEDQGLCVVDADLYHEGVPERLAALNLPDTYTVSSPRGGKHFYFVGSLRATVGDHKHGEDYALGPGIDTRGRGSYVLVPPSVVEGKPYVLEHDRPAVACPVEIEARTAPRHQQVSTANVERDLPGNVQRARTRLADLVRGGVVARLGHRGDDTTYDVACELVRDLGLSQELALKLMLEDWYPHCEPNDQPEFVASKIASAVAYGQNAPGAYAMAPASETFDAVNLARFETRVPATIPAPQQFKMLGTKEQNALPVPGWLLKEVLPEKRIVLMSAQKGHFKTFLALEMALGVAAHKETFGHVPEEEGIVVYSAHESLEEIARMHRPAWFTVHGIPFEEEVGFFLTEGVRLGDELSDESRPFTSALEALVEREGKPMKLLVLDTLSACLLGFDENDPNSARGFVKWCREIIARFGCTILIVAHKGKDGDRGTRGSSGWEYDVDSVLDVTRDGDSHMVRLKVRHHRGAPERAAPFCFEGHPIGNSLVFSLLTKEQREIMHSNDPYSKQNVIHKLIGLNALNDDNSAPTRVLAMKIWPQEKGQSDIRYEAIIKDAELKLRQLSRTSLQLFAFGRGNHLRWALPEGYEVDADGLDD